MNVSPQLTMAGWELLTRAIGGETITFTRMKVGDGAAPANPGALTDLVNTVYEFGITGVNTETPQQVVVTGRFDSSQIAGDFWFRECGLFCAADQVDTFSGDGATVDFTLSQLESGGYPFAIKGVTVNGSAFTGDTSYDAETGTLTFGTAPAAGDVIEVDALEENLLYAYLNAGDEAGLVEKADALPREFVINMAVVVGEAANVTAILTTEQAYASKEDLDALDALLSEHINARNNPHNVTAAQLGLSNVAAPQYTPASGSSPLTPGESLGAALAKIAGHINDTDNPHDVSLEELSGVLPVSNGGTGVTTISALKALIGGNVVLGTYTGNGTALDQWRPVVTFPSTPKFIFTFTIEDGGVLGSYSRIWLLQDTDKDAAVTPGTLLRLSGNTYQVRNIRVTGSYTVYYSLNASGVKYYYFYSL